MQSTLIICTKEDRNTILAALRFYQEKGMGEPVNRSDAIHDIATNGDEDISYDDGDIDDLCERVNSAQQPQFVEPFEPAPLYVEAFTSHHHPDVRWAKLELTPVAVNRILMQRALCVTGDVDELLVAGSPCDWQNPQQWKPDNSVLHVTRHDFWYTADAAGMDDAVVQTQPVTIETLIALLGQQQPGESDSKMFAWHNGALYCDGSDAELLADDVHA